MTEKSLFGLKNEVLGDLSFEEFIDRVKSVKFRSLILVGMEGRDDESEGVHVMRYRIGGLPETLGMLELGKACVLGQMGVSRDDSIEEAEAMAVLKDMLEKLK